MVMFIRETRKDIHSSLTRFRWSSSIPNEDTLVGDVFEYFLLQTKERLRSFTVYDGDVNPEDPHQAVCLVLLPGRAALRSPEHPPGDADSAEGTRVGEDVIVDPCGGLKRICEAMLSTENTPVAGEEDDDVWRNEFLQRPTPCMPCAATK